MLETILFGLFVAFVVVVGFWNNRNANREIPAHFQEASRKEEARRAMWKRLDECSQQP